MANESEVSEESYKFDGKLSYSSFSTFMSCKRKFAYYKIFNYARDLDNEDDALNLRVGKAFHLLLEKSRHLQDPLNLEEVSEVCFDYELDEDMEAMVLAMLRSYRTLRAKTTLTPFAYEVEVNTPDFRGFIDVVYTDVDGGWWIGDMKTGASYSIFLNASLNLNWQLNLYAQHKEEVAALVGLDVKKFKGCVYTLVVKSRIKRKPNEDFDSYADRMTKSIVTYEIPIPKDELDPKEIWTQFKTALVQARSLAKMSDKLCLKTASPNYNACSSYYKPCEYWSRCYGKNYTELKERTVLTSED